MSGMNLPYHVAAFTNATEAGFLRRIITGPAPGPGTVSQPSYRARINGADSAQVNVTSSRATGVLFKENDYPDWQATIDGNPATIFPAGPGMMYVPLPQGTSTTVDLFYRLSPFEEAASAVTLLTVLAVVLYIVVPGQERGLASTAGGAATAVEDARAEWSALIAREWVVARSGSRGN